MVPEVRDYLEQVRAHLNLDPQTERRILSELSSHFQEKIAELREAGAAEPEAAREAIRSFGSARLVARLSYEAYSRGSWLEALISAQPHLIASALFATHFWRRPAFLAGSLALLGVTTLLAWHRGKPNWVFSWASYVFIPLLAGVYASRRLLAPAAQFILEREGGVLSLLPLLPLAALYAASLWLLVSATVRALRKDWLFASLMLVPLPITGIWVFHVERLAPLARSLSTQPHRWDAAMAGVLLVLAVCSAVFVRLRQRILKTGALLAIGGIGAAAVARSVWDDLSPLGLVLVTLLALGFAWSPVLLRSRREPAQEEPWQGEPQELPESRPRS